MAHKTKYCSRACVNTHQKGEGNPAFGKTYRTKATHPDWAAQISKTSKDTGVNVGDKNGMKKPENAAKVSATRIQIFKDHPEIALEIAQRTADAWRRGEYDEVATGTCKWYDHTKSNGEVISVQGTWELAFVRKLDLLGLDYISHPKDRWTFKNSEGDIERSYGPDFYLPMFDTFIDIKGVFWLETQLEKMESVRKYNPDKCLFIATKDDLINWGVDYKLVQDEVLD